MNPENDRPGQADEIPEGATVIRQVTWAWVWSSIPFTAVIAVLWVTQIIPDPTGLLYVIMLAIIIVPRFWQWKNTAYYLTDDSLIYQRGSIFATRRYNIPYSRLMEVKSREGMFGRGLGYQAVDIMLENRGYASLSYIPIELGVAEQLRERMFEAGGGRPEDPNGDGP